MGCGDDVMDFVADPIGSVIGIKGPGTLTQPWEWGNLGADIAADWSTFKHWMVPDMRRDREATLNDSIGNRRLIYGRARVGVQMCYAITGGSKNEFLHLIVIFCGHPVHSIDEVWLGDKLITDALFTGKVSHELYLGTQTTACASMMAVAPGLWTANHKLLGCTYGYFKFTYDEKVFPSGLPQIKATIKGFELLDPRNGTTYWSDNPALCSYHYMLYPANLGGMGCSADEIDTASVITAANRCDGLVI